jgi:uncharacterized membrane protein YraQ (UPF0718 family)
MKILSKIKDNLFIIIIGLAYLMMFILKPSMGVVSVKNSAYYIKEMLMIMPVIFILTGLLDVWVEKEKIMKYLGNESKAKGVILAFVLGSISAGPIYAAFPMCIMLHKKGASVRNLIIILSAWAVIKIPMLINEVKFLGIEFMVIRWGLTIVAIVIFSWIGALIVKEKDLPQIKENKKGLIINQNACIGCGLCAKNHPDLFKFNRKKAEVKEGDYLGNDEKIRQSIKECPVHAIEYYE